VPKQKDINHIAKFRRRSCPRRCECACSRRGHGPAVSGILMSTDTVRWRFRRYVSFINQPARNVRDDYSSYGHLTCSYVPTPDVIIMIWEIVQVEEQALALSRVPEKRRGVITTMSAIYRPCTQKFRNNIKDYCVHNNMV